MRGLTGQRMCIACRKYREKEALFRVMREGGSLLIDPGRKHFGRSAYLCRTEECVEKALRKNLVRKHLGRDLGEEAEARLREETHES